MYRFSSLDYIRSVAIISVILHHTDSYYLTTRMGWAGVDLFFVLSGFLISGLLFRELKNTGKIRPWRFFIRRVMKIYPLFYFFLFIHIAYYWYKGHPPTFDRILNELVFIQNYVFGIMGVTWSLAVEEHFYLLIMLLVLFVSRKRISHGIKLIPVFSCLIFIVCLLLRLWTEKHNGYVGEYVNSFPSHLRIDSLFGGVVVSYLYHFRRPKFEELARKRVALLFVSALSLALILIFRKTHPFMITWGYLLITIGFSSLIVYGISIQNSLSNWEQNKYLKVFFLLFREIGKASYGIYLIHFLIGPAASNFIRENIYSDLPTILYVSIYFLSSILVGVIFTRLIERPILAYRDRRFK